MQLRYINLRLLIEAAGGDPWRVNNTLQSGNPAAVDELAQAFHNAGVCTAASSAAFAEARQRFQAAWNRENGEHPINDSLEVQRATTTLHLQQTQLTAIGTDLETIAAALAEAQKSAAAKINALEIQLQDIDNRIGMYQRADLDTSELEQVAIDDTAGILHQIEKLRDDYAGILQASTTKLLSAGYDVAPLHGPLTPAPTAPRHQPAFEDLLRANDQAVLDAKSRVRAAQKTLDDTAAKAYAQGAGSEAAHDAMTRLPALKKNLAEALDDLGKIPDYSKIDPASVHLGPDGAVSFAYTLAGQKMVVTGTLKNGSGEIYDQGAGSGSSTYFTYQDGKLVASRFLDPGRVTPDDALLQNVIFTAVGAGPAVTAGKAGVEAGWQGMRALFTREAAEAGGGTAAGLTADNVLPLAITQAEIRAQAAADDLVVHHPGVHTPITTSGDHIPSAITQDHVPHGSPHVPTPAAEVHPLPADSPLFDGYHPIEPGPQFIDSAGHPIYPNDSLASKPYAIPGTVIPDAKLAAGTELGRFGSEYGGYMAPKGTPFAELSLPPESATKPYLRYIVNDPTALPPGWHIEQSQTAAWFHQPGGGTQFRIIDEFGETGSLEQLIRSGFLRRQK
ncbi:TNT domain-containing protein [[Mycobacterium] nativiensis]|uniref:TNT domain-containing protein n=1 Tax=[Mycobacterium] nativiensis TaxID=2855503 RepID=A0ABU5XQY0_9MYCO|nr:TNT domain-containing protein [Mycolicibacter sp. MYC340]MEB3030384.1 TNT domain-containing protein [Mycolicibacter sp. MYC340]